MNKYENQEMGQKIIEVLEHLRKRPYMYIGHDMPDIVNFMNGFHQACSIVGIPLDRKIYIQVVREHGWISSSRGFWYEMIEKGFSDEKIIDEVISIYLEAWKRYLNLPT